MKKNRRLFAWKLYLELGFLSSVGKKMGITGESVRHLLVEGDNLKLLSYRTTRHRRLDFLLARYKKPLLERKIEKYKCFNSVCANLNIKPSELERIMKIYGISCSKGSTESRKDMYLKRYKKIVRLLGHHPTTSELESNLEFRRTRFGIFRHWGSIKNFRQYISKKYGKKIICVRAKTNKHSIKNFQGKIYSYLLQKGQPVRLLEICEKFGVSKCVANYWLKRAIISGKIIKMKESALTRYIAV